MPGKGEIRQIGLATLQGFEGCRVDLRKFPALLPGDSRTAPDKTLKRPATGPGRHFETLEGTRSHARPDLRLSGSLFPAGLFALFRPPVAQGDSDWLTQHDFDEGRELLVIRSSFAPKWWTVREFGTRIAFEL